MQPTCWTQMRILTWRLVGLEHFDLHTSTAGHAGAASGQIFAKVWWWLRSSSAPSLPQVRKTIIEAFGDGLASVPCSVESHGKTNIVVEVVQWAEHHLQQMPALTGHVKSSVPPFGFLKRHSRASLRILLDISPPEEMTSSSMPSEPKA